MSYGNGRSFGGGQAREQRFERPRHAESSPYVHPSRQQTVPANVDLTAPVIHFGTSREVAPRQSMKDQHFARAQDEKNQVFLTPATKEQKLLTLFVGGIGAETDDYWMDRILKVRCTLLRSCNFLTSTVRRKAEGLETSHGWDRRTLSIWFCRV